MLTSPNDVTTPKQRRKRKRSPIERLIRWGPWHYRFWREIARWCYEQSLHNPAVVDAALGFPAHRELLQNYDAIRRETLEIALSGRLPANREIMKQHPPSFAIKFVQSSLLLHDFVVGRQPT